MGHELRHKKLLTHGLGFAALAATMATVLAFGQGRAAESSLSNSEIEFSELKLTLDKVLGENKQLQTKLSDTEKTLADMRKNLVVADAECEVFKRKTKELTLKIEALGLESGSADGSKLKERFLNAVSDLRDMAQERKKMTETLVRLAEAASLFAKTASGASTESRVALEAELRNATLTLGASSSTGVEATAVPSAITDAMAISVKDDLALVVLNVGSKQGVRNGMPFQVTRDGRAIGIVRVVDVREKISGAVIQNLFSEKDRIQQGDHLKVDAQQ